MEQPAQANPMIAKPARITPPLIGVDLNMTDS
jgi:hypothetical protein